MADDNAGQAAKPPRVASIIAIVIVALASVAYGVVSVAHAREFLARHRTTIGVVTAASLNAASVGGCTDSPCTIFYVVTIRYQPPDSAPLTFTDRTYPRSIDVGTHIPVYYSQSDPGDPRLDPGRGGLLIGICLITAGLAGLAIGHRKYRTLRRGARGRAG